jgi:hypothetical protein
MNSHAEPSRPGPFAALPYAVGAGVVGALGLFLASAPIGLLLGAGSHTVIGAYHGAAATLFLILATIGLCLGGQLARERLPALRDLQVVSVATALLSLVTVIFGTWLYIPYRAPVGAKSFLVATYPAVHTVFFEFKEFIALFTLPLAVAAAFILLRYGPSIPGRRGLRLVVAGLVAAVFIFLVVAFGLGASITKIKSV